MSVIIRVKGVDWSGKGFPLVSGFVALANIEAAFDFRPRENRLLDVSGKGFVATPYRNLLLANKALVADDTVLEETSNGLGLIVRNGALDYGLPNRPCPVGGSEGFTLMVVGGYSGIPFDLDQPVQNAGICSFLDSGNGVTLSESMPMLQQNLINGSLGGRVKHGSISNVGAVEHVGKKSCFFLSYDGQKFVYTNKTTGVVVTKTNAELGITGLSIGVNVMSPRLISGNNYTSGSPSAITGHYPELYQVAKWNKVLNDSEMQAQYASSKLLFSTVGI